MVDQLDPCQDILNKVTANPNPTTFDNGNGEIYFVDGTACWESVNQYADAELATATASLEAAKNFGINVTSLEAQIAEVRKALEYSSGLAVYTTWEWDESTLSDGDVLAVCVHQDNNPDAETSAACWTQTFSSGSYTTNSYLIKPS